LEERQRVKDEEAKLKEKIQKEIQEEEAKGKLDLLKMKMTLFWDVAPCSLVETDRRFRGTCCLHHQDDV
jgi:hypothetical protein